MTRHPSHWRERYPLDGDKASEAVITDGHGGFIASGWDGTVRVDPTGSILWRRYGDATQNCVALHPATADTIACGSYGGLSIVDLDTGETTGTHAPLQYNRKAVFATIDSESLLAFPTIPPVWVRWRIDGGGAGTDVIARGRELIEGPDVGGSLVVTQPAGGGQMQLWDIVRDAPVGAESGLIIAVGQGVVARFDEYEAVPLYARYAHPWGSLRLEQAATGDEIPLRIPGLPDSVTVHAGGWGAPAFAAWPDGVIAFDPSTGLALGPALSLPDEGFTEVKAISETPDETRAVITWYNEKRGAQETGVFDISTGDIIARGLFGLEASLAVDDERMVGIGEDYARIYDIRTLEPVSALPRAAGGGNRITVSLDGRTLLNVGYNNTLTLYDLTAEAVLGRPIDGPTDATRVPGGFLTADGKSLLQALPDGIRIWDLRTQRQAEHACALAGRELTADEWSTYFPGQDRVDTCAALGQK